MVKKLSELYLSTRRALAATEDMQTAGMLARTVICHYTQKTPEQFLADSEMYVSDKVCDDVANAVERLLAEEPLAYILGEWDFCGMRLQVDPRVLIPRDDTCAVTELAIQTLKAQNRGMRVLDLCTGSGCIGLALAKSVPDIRVTLADLSKDALNVARRNASALGLNSRVSCVQANALQEPPAYLSGFDLIISNPPYITEAEMLELPDSVKKYEPHLALYGGTDGLDFYRSIASNYKKCLLPGGFLCFEFGMGQGDAVCEILEQNAYTILERTRDYNQRERAVLACNGRKED